MGDFEEFVQHGYGRLLGYAIVLTGGRDEAEEVVQEALFRCLRRWRARSVEHQMAYARRAVFHVFLNRYRRGRRETALEWGAHGRGDWGVAGGSAVGRDVAEGVVERDRLVAALGVLPPRQRAVVVARFVLDLSEEHAARELRCSVGSVKSQASRGLARLRDLLGEPVPVVVADEGSAS